MRAIVSVYDKRTFNGLSTRGKDVSSIDDAIKWAKKVNNKILDSVTIINSGTVTKIKL